MFEDENENYVPPGPAGNTGQFGLNGGQSPGFTLSTANKGDSIYQLAYYIAQYAGVPMPPAASDQTNTVKTLICPGFQNTQNIGNVASNIMFEVTQGGTTGDNGSIPNNDTWWAFGYPGKGAAGVPHKVQEIQNEAQLPLADIWILADVDKVVVINDNNNLWWPQLPAQPSHVSLRNFLYYDGHVGIKHIGPPGYIWNPQYGPEY
jgi:prepilin-type processing-associated H-X9-DG protein